MQKRKPRTRKVWKEPRKHRRVDPAILLQREEGRLCTCDAAGSGEGHADWCVAEMFNRIPQSMSAEKALEWIKDNHS